MPPCSTPPLTRGQNGMNGQRWQTKKPGATTTSTGTRPCRLVATMIPSLLQRTVGAACTQHLTTTKLLIGGSPWDNSLRRPSEMQEVASLHRLGESPLSWLGPIEPAKVQLGKA